MDTKSGGFTYIEVIVVLGIVTTLFAIGSVVLFRSQQHTARAATVDVLIADLKSQQMNAMSGSLEGGGSNERYGVKMLSNSYVLFRGSEYNASDAHNRTIVPEDGSTFSTTFPTNVVVFEKGSGEIISFISGADSITATSPNTTDQKTIRLNQYGVVVSVN